MSNNLKPTTAPRVSTSYTDAEHQLYRSWLRHLKLNSKLTPAECNRRARLYAEWQRSMVNG